MTAKALICALLVVSSFAFSGCAVLSRKEESPSKTANLLEPASIQKFGDVPVPSGFRLLANNSYTFESAGIRVGVLKYRGKANPDQVINFYKDQMPIYNWTFLNVIEYGDRLINFDRENETCTINMLAKGNSITLTISVGPKSTQPPKKQGKPLK
jgi:hypothetical protein